MSEIKTVKFGDFEMDYFSFGHGDKTFVIIPGVSLKSVMLSADAIEAAYSVFAAEYTVYCFEYAKHLRPGYSVSNMADDLALAMRILDIRDAYMFGVSLGGMVLQYLEIRHPELVSKMVLASTLSRNNEYSRSTMSRWRDLALAGDVRTLNIEMREHIYSEDFLKQWNDSFVAIENDGTPDELNRIALTLDACVKFNAYSELDKITCPVLAIGSLVDKALLPESMTELADKLGCEIYMYEGYGHAVYDEAPDYKERLMNFFKD